MQKARRHSFPALIFARMFFRIRLISEQKLVRGIELRLLVGAWFQVLFTPLEGVLFIVQSPYLFTIGRQVVLSLGGWTPQLHTEFHELRATLETSVNGGLSLSRTGLSPSMVPLSIGFG